MTARTTQPPSADEARLAAVSSRALARFAGSQVLSVQVGESAEKIELPAVAVHLLIDVLSTLADGNAVSLIPIHAELTTQEAAQILGTSRPYLIKLLEKNQIPFRLVGSHRRILFQDLLEYKKRDDERRKSVLKELANSARDLSID